jgi:hypothetical protein
MAADRFSRELTFSVTGETRESLDAKLGAFRHQMSLSYPNVDIGAVTTGASHVLVSIHAPDLPTVDGYADTAARYLSECGVRALYVGAANVAARADDSSDAPQPMDTAPTNGEVIEALYEGEWFEVRWSSRAYDGSPFGTAGWMDVEYGNLQLDLEGWREAAEYRSVDEHAEDIAQMEEAEKAADTDRKAAARLHRRPRRTKAEMAAAREWEVGRPARTAEALRSVMRGFGF